jgi:hypothetical protein
LQLPVIGFALGVHAQVSVAAVKIAVLNDRSGGYAGFGGPGAMVAMRWRLKPTGTSMAMIDA